MVRRIRNPLRPPAAALEDFAAAQRPLPGHREGVRQAALKVLYLAVRNLEEFRSPNAGIRSAGWKQALQAFTIYFDGRIPIS